MASLRDSANIGRRLRELRLERGLQQADFARTLGVSGAYLNLLEKGKRTVQLPLLWKSLSFLGIEMEAFMASLGERRPTDAVAKLLDEPLLRSLGITNEDIVDFSGEPKRTATLVALFNLYKNTHTQLEQMATRLAEEQQDSTFDKVRLGYSPLDEITDFLQKQRNYFGELEAEASRIRIDHKLGRRILSDELIKILKSRKVRVEFQKPGKGSVVRRYDPKKRLLVMSTALMEQPLKFQLATTIGLRVLDESKLDERLSTAFGPKHAETPQLIKIHLANYFAGALLLPYEEFIGEVERTRYDIELLSNMFEMSYEAVAHRVCNLGDPKRPGLPLHFVRCDVAGNISKRYSATGLRFPEASGSCAKWAVHNAFLTPSVITRQYSMMPDGSTYFCFARVASQPLQGSLVRGTTYSIGLGTHTDAARHLVYAQDMPYTDAKMAIPVGVSCRFCERTDCNQRAAPSLKFRFNVDEYTKKDNFFSPLVETDRSE
ncbi:MAG: Transcriptional regulator, family [Myxococcales bacterium]|nr:Transcriptional regulator, family [Myxococcales bacterium]